LVEIIGVIKQNMKECEEGEVSKEAHSFWLMTLLSVTAILGFSPIYLKAGYAFGFSSSACFIFVSVIP
jgi:hypothetical protein